MTATTPTTGGNSTSSTSDALSDGDTAVNNEIALMNKAFLLATTANAEITVAKTVDGAEETAAQQRPNIG